MSKRCCATPDLLASADYVIENASTIVGAPDNSSGGNEMELLLWDGESLAGWDSEGKRKIVQSKLKKGDPPTRFPRLVKVPKKATEYAAVKNNEYGNNGNSLQKAKDDYSGGNSRLYDYGVSKIKRAEILVVPLIDIVEDASTSIPLGSDKSSQQVEGGDSARTSLSRSMTTPALFSYNASSRGSSVDNIMRVSSSSTPQVNRFSGPVIVRKVSPTHIRKLAQFYEQGLNRYAARRGGEGIRLYLPKIFERGSYK
jgi:hypothetical protein